MPLSPRDQELRRGRMTATRIVKVAGLSPYGNAHDVFAEMVEGKEFEGNEATKRGDRVEPVIRDWASERLGCRFRVPGTIIHPHYDHICATVDGLRDPDEDLILECKSLDFARVDECGPDGSDEIPGDWIAQAQIQMACLDIPRAQVAVMFGVSELRLYPLAYDPEMFGMLREIGERFLRDHVQTGRPPPVDGSDSCAEALARRFPKTAPVIADADPEAERWARALFVARKACDEAEALKKEAENHLKGIIGGAEGMVGDGWRISWKTTKGKPSIDWEAVCADAKVPKSLIEKHTTRTPYRVFRPTLSKEK